MIVSGRSSVVVVSTERFLGAEVVGESARLVEGVRRSLKSSEVVEVDFIVNFALDAGEATSSWSSGSVTSRDES